jgi:hypothetical protein
MSATSPTVRTAGRLASRHAVRALLACIALSAAGFAAPASAQSEAAPDTSPETGTATDRFLRAHGDFAEKARRFVPMLELSALYMPDAELHGEPGEFDLRYLKLDSLFPIPLDRDTFLLAGAHLGARDYDFSGVSGAEDDVLYNAGLKLGAGHFIHDDLVAQGYWQPSLYSDLDGTLNSDDWKLWYGAALATYRCREDLFLKAGFILTDAIDTGAIPLVGAAWIFDPEWRLDLLLPRHAELSWSPSPVLNLHVGFESEPEEFHVRTSTAAGDAQTDVHVQDIRVYLGAAHRLSDALSIFAKVGSTVAGHYEWRDGDATYDGHLEPALFVQVGFGVTF